LPASKNLHTSGPRALNRFFPHEPRSNPSLGVSFSRLWLPDQPYLARIVDRLGIAYSGFLSTKLLTRLGPSSKADVDVFHQSEFREYLNSMFSGRH